MPQRANDGAAPIDPIAEQVDAPLVQDPARYPAVGWCYIRQVRKPIQHDDRNLGRKLLQKAIDFFTRNLD